MSHRGLRVVGVDPGTRVVGYGILDVRRGRNPTLAGHGAIRLAGTIPERLKALFGGLRQLLAEHRPDVLAVETVFHGKSFESVLKVGEARGVVLLAGALQGVEVQEYTPAMVKRTVTGNGRASKEQVQRMMVRLLELERPPVPMDVTDALALAYCHGQRLWRQELPGERVRSRRSDCDLTR